jgi:protein SCO1
VVSGPIFGATLGGRTIKGKLFVPPQTTSGRQCLPGIEDDGLSWLLGHSFVPRSRAMRAGLCSLVLSSLVVSGCQGNAPDRAEHEPAAKVLRIEVDGPGDDLPELGTIADFRLTDQRATAFTGESVAGQPWLAAFMFTRCPTICPQITARMREVQTLAKQKQVPLRLVSFSVDPDFDTPEVLKAYADKYGVDQASWSFVTGDNAVIRGTAEYGFKLSVEGTASASAPGFGISHGSHLVLLDGKRTIRGYYRSSEPESVARIVADAARLNAAAPPAAVGQR